MSKKKNVTGVMGEIKKEENKRKEEQESKKREEREAEEKIKTELVEVFVEEELYEEDEDELKKRRDAARRERLKKVNAELREKFAPVIRISGYILGGLLIVVGILFLILLNTPKRRFERNYLKAETLFAKSDFTGAIAKYDKALSIDPASTECYLGKLVAKQAVGAEDVKETFENGLTVFEGLEPEVLEGDKQVITEYVLHENEVYADDPDMRINSLERGYNLTAGNTDIARILTECASERVAYLRNTGEFDKAVELLNRLSGKLDIDDKALIADLSKEKGSYELKKKVLGQAYEALKDYVAGLSAGTEPDFLAFDFSKIMAVDGSDEATQLVNTKAADSYIYIPSENYNEGSGTGAGIYTFGGEKTDEEGNTYIGYSIYVGDFKDGLREGNGVLFTRTGEDSFVMFAGKFRDDVANGTGSKYFKDSDGEKYTYTSYKGNWDNNLASGNIDIAIRTSAFPDVVFSGAMDATLGKGAVIPTESDEYVVQNLRSDNLVAVLASSTEGYSLMLSVWQRTSDVLSAAGISAGSSTQ